MRPAVSAPCCVCLKLLRLTSVFCEYNTNIEWFKVGRILYSTRISLFNCTERCFHSQNRVLIIRNKEKSLKGQYECGYVTLPKYTVMRKSYTGVHSSETPTELFLFFQKQQMNKDLMFRLEPFIKQPGKEYLLCSLWSERDMGEVIYEFMSCEVGCTTDGWYFFFYIYNA